MKLTPALCVHHNVAGHIGWNHEAWWEGLLQVKLTPSREKIWSWSKHGSEAPLAQVGRKGKTSSQQMKRLSLLTTSGEMRMLMAEKRVSIFWKPVRSPVLSNEDRNSWSNSGGEIQQPGPGVCAVASGRADKQPWADFIHDSGWDSTWL